MSTPGGPARTFRILAPLAAPETVPDLVSAACELARALGAELTLLHVVAVPIGEAPETPARRAEAERIFALARGLVASDVRARFEARFAGHVGGAIRTALRELDIDLMLVGWRDAASLDRLARGTLRPILQNPVCDVAMLRLGSLRPYFARHELNVSITPLALRIVANFARAHGSTLAIYDSLGAHGRARVLPFARRSMIYRLLQERAPGLPHDVFLGESPAPLPETLARLPPFDIAILPASWDPTWRGLELRGLAAGDQGSVLLLALRT